LTVALVVPAEYSFPDNWIYIHEPGVRVGRIQNFGSWSPFLVKDGRTCLGMEYFVNEGDDMWTASDEELVELASREIEQLKLVRPGDIEVGYVVRVPKAYPVYDGDYAENLDIVRKYLKEEWPDVHPVGRNGMHRYNNQDHSMLAAMITVDNLVTGASEDVWEVNVDEEYHEESRAKGAPAGTGRSAPVIG
jgi:protoporphyrinogen oxidase